MLFFNPFGKPGLSQVAEGGERDHKSQLIFLISPIRTHGSSDQTAVG